MEEIRGELKDIIKVLVVEDSPLMCKVLTTILNSDPQLIVVGTASNGKEAVDIVPKLKPDIITMDIHMPIMDGFEATKYIMAYNPTPIIIVSTSVFKVGMEKVFKAISYGALDVLDKGKIELEEGKNGGGELIEKIKFFSKVKVIHHPLARLEEKASGKIIRPVEVSSVKALDRIVAIASSTGGPQALLEILRSLPAEFPCGIVIVQHITKGFIEGLVEWLDSECEIKVKVGEDSEEIQPGVVYFAPCDVHMKIEERGRIHLSNNPPCEGLRPSGDMLLETVAKVYGPGAIGVILTGMGRDGSVGIKAIKQMHGHTIAQDEKSCIIFGMPKAAIEMNAIDEVMPLEKIAQAIVNRLK